MTHRAQFQSLTWPSNPSKIIIIHKPYKNLHFLSVPINHSLSTPLVSSFSFPLIPKFPCNLLPFHPVQDATQEHILEDIENSMRNHPNLENLIKLELLSSHNRQIICPESSKRVFIEDPPWISALFFNGLYKIANRELKLAPNLPYVKGLFLGWFEPLKEAIKEQNLQRSKKQKATFASPIELKMRKKKGESTMAERK
uniref:DNA-directed RNA polymerase n=1 Tax=Manihot esculenta TaxID=3983 RepID=A0A2C9VPM9_MANES